MNTANAEYLPSLSDNKLLHSRAVAEKMRTQALLLGWDASRADDMYLLGFIHDIGYCINRNHHSNAGSLLLARNEYRYSFEVRHHGRPVDNPSDELLLLWWADLTTSYDGSETSIRHRIANIEIRYGAHSHQYQNAVKLTELLYIHGHRIGVDING